MRALLEFAGLAVIAEVSIGLAGFSGVMIVLTRTSGGFNPPERFRLQVLVYSSMGPLFLALMPFAVLDSIYLNDIGWRILSLVVAIYSIGGLVTFPRMSYRLRREYPELFPLKLIVTQASLHLAVLVLALFVCLDLTSHGYGVYTAALILLLLHGAIAFVRLLFYRRHDSEV